MEISAELGWASITLAGNSTIFNGHRRAAQDFSTEYDFMKQHLLEVRSNGGVIFRREFEPRATQTLVDPWGNKGFKYDAPQAELWYLPHCSFRDSLELLDAFQFPSSSAEANSEYRRERCREILLELAAHRDIAVLNFAPSSIFVQVVRGAKVDAEDVARVLQFNSEHFQIEYEKDDYQDLLAQYVHKQIFVLGDV